jgi:hypothetical protein
LPRAGHLDAEMDALPWQLLSGSADGEPVPVMMDLACKHRRAVGDGG